MSPTREKGRFRQETAVRQKWSFSASVYLFDDLADFSSKIAKYCGREQEFLQSFEIACV
jgi:hypothetical protein